jgi:hypothetical protein
MRNAILGFTVGPVIVMLIAIVQAQAFGSSTQGSRTVAQANNSQVPPQAAKGPTVVEGKIAVARAGEAEGHFHNARESFLKKNAEAAAAEIRTGAAFLKLEAGHASEEEKKALTASVRELEKLAQRVEKENITLTRELERVFARADRTLAKQHFQKTAESWSKKQIKKAGQELKSAANDIKLAWSGAGHKLDATTTTVIKDARTVAAN